MTHLPFGHTKISVKMIDGILRKTQKFLQIVSISEYNDF